MPFLINAHISGFHKVHCLSVAEPDTLGITVAQIAFKDLLVLGIITHSAKGANRHAGTTADADVIVNFNVLQVFVTRNRLHRAHIQARGILALLT